MPYIKLADRARLGLEWQGGDIPTAKTPGELNFLFTMILKHYLKERGESYQTYNDIIGALECCKLELYRRNIGLYENQKIQNNGDVW
jgi:hypothetical protein